MTSLTARPHASVTLSCWINRSCTVERLRAPPMHGLSFSGDTPHTASQLSLFVGRNTSPTGQGTFVASTARGRTVQCIRKRRTKPFATSSVTSTVRSTVPSGQRDGMAASSGHAVKSSTRMDASTSTRCYQRRLTISTVLSLATPGTNGGTANLVATRSNSREVNITSQPTSASTSPKKAKSISPRISGRGSRRVPTTP